MATKTAARARKRPPRHKFEIAAKVDRGTRKIILDGLVAYNRDKTGKFAPRKPLAVVVKNSRGRVLGGALGYSFWSWTYIELLWLPDELRRKGQGRKIMELAEAEARRRGCIGMYLNTASFQAPEFYPKLGFEVIAMVDDFPPGHRNYYLLKRFGT